MYAAQYWADEGMPRDKIVIGMPTYGQVWLIHGATGIPPPNTIAQASTAVSVHIIAVLQEFILLVWSCLTCKHKQTTPMSDFLGTNEINNIAGTVLKFLISR